MPETKNKKIIILISLLILFLTAGFIIYFASQKSKPVVGPETPSKQKTLAEKQLKELEELRNEAGTQPLTEEQMLAQQKELEALREKSDIKSLTQEQIQKQLEELEKLRQGR